VQPPRHWGEVCGTPRRRDERRRNLIASETCQEGIIMRSWLQRPASPRAAAANHPPAVPRPTPGGDTGRPRKLTADNTDPNLATCYLPRRRSLGTDAIVEVFR
jgi:hypothetical protein